MGIGCLRSPISSALGLGMPLTSPLQVQGVTQVVKPGLKSCQLIDILKAPETMLGLKPNKRRYKAKTPWSMAMTKVRKLVLPLCALRQQFPGIGRRERGAALALLLLYHHAIISGGF